MNNKDYWGQVAKHHIASRRLYHVDAIVHVEDVDDIAFWRSIIKYVRPKVQLKFIAADCGPTGVRTTGKNLCLKYLPYLSSSFFICVDSDFDYLLNSDLICANRFVLQTYTYSWENHYCFARALQKRWEAVNPKSNFDFGVFVSRLSSIIYSPLLTYLISKQYRRSCFSLEELCSAILKVQLTKEALKNNGELLLDNISKSISELTVSVIQVSFDVSLFIKAKSEKGLIEDTAYLYMQGHCIYDLVNRIGRFLTDGSQIDFEYQVLRTNLYYDGYAEIKRVQSDILFVV